MIDPCPTCGATTRTPVKPPSGSPHHAAERCGACGRFLRWLPRPAGVIPDHCLEAAVPRASPVPLRGTARQVEWATSIRTDLLRRAAAQPRLAQLLMTIDDATWFIANRGRPLEQLRWPAVEQLASAGREDS